MSWKKALVHKSAGFSLRQNTLTTFISNFSYSLTQWGVLIAIAKLSDDAYVGIFGLALAISGPLYLLFNMELNVALATDAQEEFPFEHYLSLRITSSVLALLLCSLIAGLFILSGSTEKGVVLLMLGFMKGIETIGDLFIGLYNRQDRMLLSSVCRATRGIVSFLVMGLTLYFFESLWLSIFSIFLAWCVLVSQLDRPLAESLLGSPISFTKSMAAIPGLLVDMKSMFLKTFWLGVTRFLNSLSIFFPRYVIDFFFGAAALGGFVAVSYVVIASQMLTTAVLSVLAPRLSREFLEPSLDGYFLVLKKAALGLGVLAAAMLLFVWFLGELFLGVAYGERYAQYANLFMLLALVSAFDYYQLLLETAINATRAFKDRFAPTVVSLVTVVVCSLVLVPTYSLNGGAFALLISKVVTSLMLRVRLSRICRQRESVQSLSVAEEGLSPRHTIPKPVV